jgi:hypothetical protein
VDTFKDVYLPVDGFTGAVEPPQHRGSNRGSGVLTAGIQVGLDEIERGFQVGVAAVFRLLLAAFGDLVEEREDLFGCDGCQIAVSAKMLTELAEGGTVGLDRIFFQNSSCGTPCRPEPPGRVS